MGWNKLFTTYYQTAVFLTPVAFHYGFLHIHTSQPTFWKSIRNALLDAWLWPFRVPEIMVRQHQTSLNQRGRIEKQLTGIDP